MKLVASLIWIGWCAVWCGGQETVPATRELQAPTADLDLFEPLKCNKVMEPCIPWTQYKGSSHAYSALVKIACGVCVTMDLPGPRIDFFQGLDVVGKLVIPEPESTLLIYSKMIVVQGELVITSTSEVEREPRIKIFMTGNGSNSFQPVWNNAARCGGGPCTVGPKAVVVAGGKVTMNGVPSNFPTWVPLYDVVSGGNSLPTIDASYIPQYVPPPLGCESDGVFVDMATGRGGEDIYLGSLGTTWRRSLDGVLQIEERTSAYMGPTVDLKNIRKCLQSERTYLVTARVRLLGGPTGYTSCSTTKSGCLVLSFDYMTSNSVLRRADKWKELPSYLESNDDVFTIASKFTLTELESSLSNVYTNFRLSGPAPGISIELLEFTMREPPQEAFSTVTNVCANLVPGNGDAELVGDSPFPFSSNSGFVKLVVGQELTRSYYGGVSNSFFQIGNRDFAPFTNSNNWQGSGLHWEVPTDCLERDTVFQ